MTTEREINEQNKRHEGVGTGVGSDVSWRQLQAQASISKTGMKDIEVHVAQDIEQFKKQKSVTDAKAERKHEEMVKIEKAAGDLGFEILTKYKQCPKHATLREQVSQLFEEQETIPISKWRVELDICFKKQCENHKNGNQNLKRKNKKIDKEVKNGDLIINQI